MEDLCTKPVPLPRPNKFFIENLLFYQDTELVCL